MHVGVLRISLHIPHARSLKEKRSVVRRFRDRIRARFEVSIAEVGAQDLLQSAVFGVSVVSADSKICDSVLAQVARAAEVQEDAILTDYSTEVIAMGDDRLDGTSPLTFADAPEDEE
jgi:uncharacterized protein YlxP (DUF503 family)